MNLRKALAPDERPRERLMRLGPRALTDAELLALLIGSGRKGRNAVALANDILDSCGGVRGLQRQSIADFKRIPGLGPARACLLSAMFEIGLRASLSQIQTGEPLTRTDLVRDYCRAALSNLPVEHCIALLMDTQNRLIETEEISRGTVSQTAIYTREVVRLALQRHASAVILAHNHPSGQATPSQEDIELTKELAIALALVDVVLLDHLIVAGPQVVSLAQLGHL